MSAGTDHVNESIRALGLEPGLVIDGRFVLQDLLGAGGQGLVFRVRHLEWNRDFALKVPLPECVRSKVARDRYVTEAETWIRMGVHPNIVRCWFVRPVQGLPGLFLDLIGGGSLDAQLKSGQIAPGNWELILFVLLQVCEGLTHSHSKGVVHRDLKPENLMMRENGQVCLTDFGLVKTLTDDETEGLEGKTPQAAMGTPRYGAPEQWTDPDTISVATDIYSLGAMMFEMISGQRPFEPPGMPIDSVTLINRHITEPPPNPLSFRRDIPKALSELCLWCMEKDPARRPESATVLMEELQLILREVGANAYTSPAPVPAGERPSLLNNAAVSLYSLGKTEKARELLLKGLMIEAGHPECIYNLVQLDRRDGKITRKESLNRLRRARATFQLALVYLEEGLGQKAIEYINRLKEDQKSGFTTRTLGDAYMYAGKYKEAVKAYQEAETLMPNDLPTKFRKQLAANSTNTWEGHSYFPNLRSCYKSSVKVEDGVVLLSPSGREIVGITPTELIVLSLAEEKVLGRSPRPAQAAKVLQSWVAAERLILQDKNGFEVWCWRTLTVSERKEGRVLSLSSDLAHGVGLTNNGVVFRDYKQRGEVPLEFPPEVRPSSHVFASFAPDEKGMGLIGPDGRVGAVQGTRVIPLPWPPPIQDLRQVHSFVLGDGPAFMATRKGLIQGLDLVNQKHIFTYDLGFSPESFEADRSGQVLVASSKLAFTILSTTGELLLRGRGPCALAPSRKHALFWLQGTLQMYQLAPFQSLKSWNEKIAQPAELKFSANGSRALSLSADGSYQVWDVDEEFRVYERQLLVTPGESYEELIQSYHRHLNDLHQAQEMFQGQSYNNAYEKLSEARSVPGFRQAEAALDLQWDLCGQLKREELQAIWERLYISDVVAAQLSPEGSRLLIAKRTGAELFSISGPNINQIVELPAQGELLGARYLTELGDEPVIMTMTTQGRLQYSHAETGETLLSKELGLQNLTHASFHAHYALLHTERDSLVSVDLLSGEIVAETELDGAGFESAFHLSGSRMMIVTEHQLLSLDMAKSGFSSWLPVSMERMPGNITFVRDEPEAKIRLVGFSDGTLIVARSKDGQPLFGINHEVGSLSGAAVHIPSALGVSVSETGGLTLFGLDTGRILERFVAHASGVSDVSITDDGRYITTLSVEGQFRLWEISWDLSEEVGIREIDWLPKSGSRLSSLFRR